MASLRDVFDHAGKKVRLLKASGEIHEGLGLLRGDVALLEPALDPVRGDGLEFLESGARFKVLDAEPQAVKGRTDHYRVRIVAR